jgi:hypothetical protein
MECNLSIIYDRYNRGGRGGVGTCKEWRRRTDEGLYYLLCAYFNYMRLEIFFFALFLAISLELF